MLDVFSPPREPSETTVSVPPLGGFRTKVEKVETVTDEGNGIGHSRYKVTLFLHGGADLGSGNQVQTVRVVTDDHHQAEALLSWRVEQAVTATPSFLHFGLIEKGAESSHQRLMLRSAENKPFRVVSVQAAPNDDYVISSSMISSDDARASVQVFDVWVAAKRNCRREALSGTLKIITSNELVSTLSIPWSALVRPSEASGAIVEPDHALSLEFGR